MDHSSKDSEELKNTVQWGDQKYSKGLKGQIGAQGCIKELNDTEKLIAQREEITDTTRKELV